MIEQADYFADSVVLLLCTFQRFQTNRQTFYCGLYLFSLYLLQRLIYANTTAASALVMDCKVI